MTSNRPEPFFDPAAAGVLARGVPIPLSRVPRGQREVVEALLQINWRGQSWPQPVEHFFELAARALKHMADTKVDA